MQLLKELSYILLEKENFNNSEIIDILKKDCSKWLKECGVGNFAWRGARVKDNKFIKELSDEFFIASVRTDRKPLGSPLWLHNALNKYFVSKTGIPVRSASLFCTGDSSVASFYGDVYAVFPIGNFNYCWSEQIADPTQTFYLSPGEECEIHSYEKGFGDLVDKKFHEFSVKNRIHNENGKPYEGINSFIIDNDCDVSADNPKSVWAKFITEFIQSTDLWTFNKGLSSALTGANQSNEVMVVCDKYYLVEFTLLHELIMNKTKLW